MELEQLCNEGKPIDFELTLCQALVNEGKQLSVLNAKRPPFVFNEKQLRDAAAAEVAISTSQMTGEDVTYGPDGKPIRKRKLLNPDEKAMQNRDRNREHAKNTRLRKKAFVMKLKELVDQMSNQTDMEERERRSLGERIYDSHVIRKNAVRLMLSYRAANVRDRDKWAAILDEGFVFTLPITPYRSFQKGDIVSSSRVIVGIDAAIADAASLALMVENVGQGTELWKDSIKRGQSCRIVYISGKDDMLAAGDVIMCRYLMRTEGHEMVGAFSPCVQHGMLQCQFNHQNKMVSAEMTFDVMGFMQQLQRASAVTPENSIVSNTIDMALQPSREARAIMQAEPPFTIMHVNEHWVAQSGGNRGKGVMDSRGNSLNMGSSAVTPSSMDTSKGLSDALRLHSSQDEQVYALAADCSIGRAGSAVLMTRDLVDPSQPAALIYLKLYPLTGASGGDIITHFLGVQIDLPLVQAEREALLAHCSFTTKASTTVLPPDVASAAMGLNININQSVGRVQGELYFRRHRQQYQMRQERITDAQLQQAYLLLSASGSGPKTTDQQTYSSSSSSHDHVNIPSASSSSSSSSTSSSSSQSSSGYGDVHVGVISSSSTQRNSDGSFHDTGEQNHSSNYKHDNNNHNLSQYLPSRRRGSTSVYDQRQGLPPPQQQTTHPMNVQQHQQQHQIQQQMQEQQHWIIGSTAEGYDEDDPTGGGGGEGSDAVPMNGSDHGGHMDDIHSNSSNECLEKSLTMSLTRGPSHEWEWSV